jgi:uncharacterized OB-fold protein
MTAAYDKPVPVPSHESKPYWEGLRRHELLMPRCAACGHRWFPPTHLCPQCRSGRVEWERVSGRGKVHTFVLFHRNYHKGFAAERPYCVAVVELEEGPRMLSNVIGIPPQEVTCEMAVEVVFEDITDTATLPKFQPVASSG